MRLIDNINRMSEIFQPSIIPGSIREKTFMVFQIITFGIFLAVSSSIAMYNKNISIDWFNASNYPIYLLSIIVISAVNIAIKLLNHKFKYTEINGTIIKIVDNLYFPRINKTIDLSKASELEFKKSFNLDVIKRPYYLYIYQMFFTVHGKKEKIPLPNWDKQTLELVLDSIKKHAPKLKVNTKTRLSVLGTY